MIFPWFSLKKSNSMIFPYLEFFFAFFKVFHDISSPWAPCEFPTQRPVTRSFDVFFDLRLNKRLSKQPWGWWFEMPSWSLWRHCNGNNPETTGSHFHPIQWDPQKPTSLKFKANYTSRPQCVNPSQSICSSRNGPSLSDDREVSPV